MEKQKRRRQRGEGAIFKRADGRYVGQIDLGYDGEGKRRRKTIYGKSTADVVAKMAAANRERADRGDIPTADMTVEKWLTYWIDDIAAPRLKPSTVQSYRTTINQYLIPALGRHKLPKLSPQHIREMHKSMHAQDLSSTTALNAHRILSSALTDAVRWNRVPRNVAALVRAPSKANNQREGLTYEETMQVLSLARMDVQHGSTWFVALMLGLRQGERLGLRWQHVDLDAGYLDVAWSLQPVPVKDGKADFRRDLPHVELDNHNLVLLKPKTKTSTRVVPLIEPVYTTLVRRKAQVEIERRDYDVDHDLVWCRPDGRPIHPRFDWGVWKALLSAAGVRDVPLHAARNTAATVLLEAGVDATTTQAILGHSNILQQRAYQKVSQDLSRAALNSAWQRAAIES